MHNVSGLLRAIAPYYWVFAIFALTLPPPLLRDAATCNTGKLRSRRNCFRLLFVLYSLLLMALSFRVTYFNKIITDTVVREMKLDSITSVLSVCASISVTVVQTLMQLTAIWDCRRLCQIFRSIAQLEQDIQAQVSLISHSHSARPYSGCFGRHLAARSGVLLLFLCILLPIVNYRLVADFMPLPDKILNLFFGLLILVKSVEYCVIVQLVHELLQQLQQQHLLPLYREIATATGKRAPYALRHANLLALQANQHLLARIWNLVNVIERYFSLPMFMLFLCNGVVVTHTINWAYIRYKETNATYNLFNMSFTSIMIVNMLVPCWISQSCIDAYNQFGSVLHNLKSNGSDVALSMRLREYSLQLMHQKMIFSCGGFFDINLKYFGAMILTITTYVVILIQFKLQAKAENEQQQHQLLSKLQHNP